MKNEIQFNIAGKDKQILITVSGKILQIDGLECVLHKGITQPFNNWDEFTPKEMHNFWQVSEYSTGASLVCIYDQRKKAIVAAQMRVLKVGRSRLQELIQNFPIINF